MSNYPPDPYPPDPDRPPEDPPGEYLPGAYPPGPDERDPYATPASAISARVSPPAVAILVVAVVNLLLSLGCFGVGFFYSQVPPDKMEEVMEKQNPGQVAQMRQAGITVDAIMKGYTYGGFGGGAIALLVSLITILGAIRMMMLRSYGLAVFVSVLTAIPCISPTACCLLGEGAGIWALVVLLNTDVRSAFR
jgi:hypothetical protein